MGGRGSRGGRQGRGGRGGGAGGNSAKEWDYLREQEERLAMVKARREQLMDLDRKKSQEAYLAGQRIQAADALSRTDDIR